MTHPYVERLNARLADTNDVYVVPGTDPQTYFRGLATSIKAHLREPERVVATVTAPGFPDVSPGNSIEGWCLAEMDGYWLVYQPEIDRFCCFWGGDRTQLTAPGIFGSPLYCWSA